jgi:hypothetical protein
MAIEHRNVSKKRRMDRAPFLPSVDLVNWITHEYTEPCSRCGGGHKDRTKYVCAQCNRLYCARFVRRISGENMHMLVWRDLDQLTRTWCGPVDNAGEWDSIADRLTKIVDDLR